MKYYDSHKIFRYVQKNKERIDRIDAGIMEDWLNTCQRIFAYGKLLIDIPTENNKVEIHGINGSMWGTPVMRVIMLDGSVLVLKCYDEQGPRLLPNKLNDFILEQKEKGVRMMGWDGVLREY